LAKLVELVAVEDNGKGIAPDEQARIREPLVGLASGKSSHHMGLAIARNIVAARAHPVPGDLTRSTPDTLLMRSAFSTVSGDSSLQGFNSAN
jgi:hypothetical protein